MVWWDDGKSEAAKYDHDQFIKHFLIKGLLKLSLTQKLGKEKNAAHSSSTEFMPKVQLPK